jgi:hypothetical protein
MRTKFRGDENVQMSQEEPVSLRTHATRGAKRSAGEDRESTNSAKEEVWRMTKHVTCSTWNGIVGRDACRKKIQMTRSKKAEYYCEQDKRLI